MTRFKSFAVSFLLLGGLIFASPMTVSETQAATSILPGSEETIADFLTAEECYEAVQVWAVAYSENGFDGLPETVSTPDGELNELDMMTCAIKSGNMHFWMIPYFVNYALEFIIAVAGLIVVLMIVLGGYYYIYGAVTDDKEKGKTIITYAIGGYALVLVSWFIVNAVLLAVTQ